MVFTVTVSLPTNLTSLLCGLRLGVAGKCDLYLFTSEVDWLSMQIKCSLLISANATKMIRFSEFGGTIHHRPVQDLAFAVARFIQKGGSYVNYYMVGFLVDQFKFQKLKCAAQNSSLTVYSLWQYHGGTNFGRTAGGPFITTSYDYDAPIDEYGKGSKDYNYPIILILWVFVNSKSRNPAWFFKEFLGTYCIACWFIC